MRLMKKQGRPEIGLLYQIANPPPVTSADVEDPAFEGNRQQPHSGSSTTGLRMEPIVMLEAVGLSGLRRMAGLVKAWHLKRKMAVSEQLNKSKRLWLWLAPLIIAVAVIGWSLYGSYMAERERGNAYTSPTEQQ